jgi:hypothetical protein
MSLTDWAERWGLPPQALVELAGIPAITPVAPSRDKVHSEAAVQALVRLEAARKGIHLWRNNRGAFQDETGRVVRYGLANDSKQLDEVLKSSDLVGIEKVLIGPQHVGHIIGRMVSAECKPIGWKYTGTPREVAQLRWISLINANGGRAMFVNCEGYL